MARRRRHDDHANHEAWAIPYGDLVTLLMAFFVVMYAVSSIDAGKYRVLSDSLEQAFGSQAKVSPVQIGEPLPGDALIGEDMRRTLAPISSSLALLDPALLDPLVDMTDSSADITVRSILEGVPDVRKREILREIGEMAGEIEEALGGLVDDGRIQVDRQAYWLEIEINTSLLFLSGSATLEPAALPVLEEVAKVLARRDSRIHVEGHTDDLPIGNSIYPSNWELSSGRAATVVNLFAQNGVDPRRMVAIGYGEFQPVASNDTAEGRARNRRVAIVVLPGPPPRAHERVEPEWLKRDHIVPEVDEFDVVPGD
ncbi:flagellar motor protein MotB [Marichromatium purpuratum 984]|uniref:Flagellar motor protein MotB n=1 Tax=Marichromatium purpuratum 984 TaxID=765910 RepID=W0E3J4_MARPU|nr:flagellar motor protein MotD [Marichromatium purpuratum]AHF03651.1 flagellar motor protein MotB [Marichromatium purpuratum 984]